VGYCCFSRSQISNLTNATSHLEKWSVTLCRFQIHTFGLNWTDVCKGFLAGCFCCHSCCLHQISEYCTIDASCWCCCNSRSLLSTALGPCTCTVASGRMGKHFAGDLGTECWCHVRGYSEWLPVNAPTFAAHSIVIRARNWMA